MKTSPSKSKLTCSNEIDENIGRGMHPREAAWAARRKFGNVTTAKRIPTL